MKTVKATFIYWILYLAACPATSQTIPKVADQLGTANGLDATVRDMAQDEDGFYWLATNRGLFRFDGVQATKINLPVPDSLAKRTDNCYDLSLDPKNQLVWVGTDLGLMRYHLRTGTGRHFHPKDFYEEKDREIQGSHVVLADGQGGVWAEFGRYGFAHLSAEGKLLETFFLPLNEREKATGMAERMANTILGISQDPNYKNILWMNARRGLLRFDKKTKQLERFLFYPENDKMLTVANSMTCHFAHPNGYVYIGTWNAGLLKFDPTTGSFTQFLRSGGIWKEANGGSIHRIVSIAADQSGNLWTDGTGGGTMFDVENERFTSPPAAGFSANFQDRDGNYWQYQPELGLYHHLENQGKKFDYPPSFPCGQTSGMPFDSRNREIYFRGVCSDGTVWSLNVDKHSWQRYALPGNEGKKLQLSAFAEGPGGYFIGNGAFSLIYFCPVGSDHFEKLPLTFPQNAGNLNIACAANGDLFVTGHSGYLFWLKPPKLERGQQGWEMTTFSKTSIGGHLPDDFHCVSTPTFDAKGRLWLKTCNGFSIFSPKDSRFQHFKCNQQGVVHLDSYQNFLSDGQQKMWASGNGGFGWFDIEKPDEGLRKQYKPPGTYRQDKFGAAFFIRGKLWFNSSEGWAEFDPKAETFRYFDFLHGEELAHVGEGRLVAFEDGGVRLMDLDSLQWSDEMPRAYVSWVKVFEKPMALPGGPLSAQPLRLRPNENFFSIGFSALATYNTAGIHFAYQLEGVNPEWVYPEPGIRAASFTNIDGGDYTFKIKTTNSRGEWLDNVFQLKIHVGTPWWKTWWFQLAMMGLLGGMVYFFVKNRLRQQQILLENQRLQLEKEVSLRKERDRIAAEMHDDLGAGLTTIRFLSLAAKEKEADPENAARIDKIAAHASQVMEKMADIIWVMNSRNDSLENFTAYLRRYAAEYLETHGLRFVMETEGTLEGRKLGGEQRRSLLSAIKECLHNVVKHAEARTVRLTIQAKDKMEITVQDDGKGLPETLLHDLHVAPNSLAGNGLRNISQRMAALGGEVFFENGKGTTVRLRMDFAA